MRLRSGRVLGGPTATALPWLPIDVLRQIMLLVDIDLIVKNDAHLQRYLLDNGMAIRHQEMLAFAVGRRNRWLYRKVLQATGTKPDDTLFELADQKFFKMNQTDPACPTERVKYYLRRGQVEQALKSYEAGMFIPSGVLREASQMGQSKNDPGMQAFVAIWPELLQENISFACMNGNAAFLAPLPQDQIYRPFITDARILWSIDSGSTETLQVFIDAGAFVNVAGLEDHAPPSFQMLQLVLHRVPTVRVDKWLCRYAEDGKLDFVRRLLSCNFTNIAKRKAALFAIARGHVEVYHVLE